MQIMFTADPKIVGRLIRYFTKRSWLGSARTSHTALRFGGVDENWMIHTDEKGFHPDWYPHFVQIRKIVFVFEVLGVDDDTFSKVVDEFLTEEVWKPFDTIGLIGMLIVCVWYWMTGKKINNPFGHGSALTCSETMYKIFKKLEAKTGTKYFEDQSVETTFPEELLKECESKPTLFKPIPIS